MVVTEVITAIEAAGTAAAALGAAVLIVLAGIRAYKWVRGAM